MIKGLDALNNLWYGQKTHENFATIEKELKALEIIKEKGIDWRRFVDCESVKEYNKPIICYGSNDFKIYTKEEYDLLKEVLENGK